MLRASMASLLVATLLLSACGDTRLERAGSGAVIGGTIGFGVGAVCCMNPPAGIGLGTAIGAGVGAVTGALLSEPLFMNHEAQYWPYDLNQQ